MRVILWAKALSLDDDGVSCPLATEGIIVAKNENVDVAPPTLETTSGKGHATPSRKEREAANKRPLVPNDRRVAAKANREAVAKQRERARIGMAAGDERYLPRRDRGPQRRFVRDYVDARYSVGELMVPLMLLVIVLTFADTLQIGSLTLAEVGILAMWGFLVVVILDALMLSVNIRRRVRAKFGAENAERGLAWYATMRSIQMRPMRMPKPQVKRRAFPE
jgi:hypothetical protein